MASPKTNRLILGLMTIGPDTELGARITSLDTYKQCLDYLSKKGYHELDTAGSYVGGKQEAFTRDADFRSRGFEIASKVYPVQPGDHEPEKLRSKWLASLEKLGVDSTDILYLHAPDRATPFETTLECVNQLYQEGRFKKLGLSNYAAWEVAEIVGICERRGFVKPAIYQGMYNAITRALEAELLPCLRKFNIDLVIYNPLVGGLFSGKYSTLDAPAEGRFSDKVNYGKMYRERYFKESVIDALALVEPVAKEHGVPLIEVALRWCVHHSKLKMRSEGGNDGVIIGISSYEQLEQNVEAFEKGPLPQPLVDVLDKAWERTRGDAVTYWR
ncbi:putative aflatoxin B1-aldehyde reductase GliO-like protein [Paraphaeosphaeria sporulosa]|uniref:Putative aflatoxin B1-aldehyde reductase GliO-like protein n=1 Tax=Paraphaeosphaeria sporulosa TaxID=1460663 RepID=A0A177CEU8_9PLEO|nr:putative aflatoxin B1-aldehyde reductase GliO-like protein [Paraphaeosphaeria sporulosa]OAG05250.1 putative aflatoxin B1-aldehyde reductase GliO-like protein [Paraphaeosphaeria sporulosa]